MKAIVCGSRDCEDEAFVFAHLDRIDSERRIEMVIEGGQRRYRRNESGDMKLVGGVDLHACHWTYARARMGMRFDADWNDLDHPRALIRKRRDGSRYNAAAGPIRNARMLAEGAPDVVIAFPGGDGTADMVRQARAAGVEVITIKTEGPS